MVKVRESNHMHGWRWISHESRFDQFTYSQDNSVANTQSHSRLKEILLVGILTLCNHCPLLLPYLQRYMIFSVTRYIRPSCILAIIFRHIESGRLVQVISCRSAFCCWLGYASLANWMMKWVSVFWLGDLEGSWT